MRTIFTSLGVFASFCVCAEEASVHRHEELKEFSMFGNAYKGLSTKALGAKEFEIWKSSLSVGSKTPVHVHETEEILIFFKGKVKAIVGEKELLCIAPSTLICPAHIPHQLINVGDEPSEQIAILGIDSTICDAQAKELTLPWR